MLPKIFRAYIELTFIVLFFGCLVLGSVFSLLAERDVGDGVGDEMRTSNGVADDANHGGVQNWRTKEFVRRRGRRSCDNAAGALSRKVW